MCAAREWYFCSDFPMSVIPWERKKDRALALPPRFMASISDGFHLSSSMLRTNVTWTPMFRCTAEQS